jgi:hypothetical protein
MHKYTPHHRPMLRYRADEISREVQTFAVTTLGTHVGNEQLYLPGLDVNYYTVLHIYRRLCIAVHSGTNVIHVLR